MVKIIFDTNIINALENVDRGGGNNPDIREYSALLNMIICRQKGGCKILSSLFVTNELMYSRVKDRNFLRRNLISCLLDEVKNPQVMHRKPSITHLTKIFGAKDAAIVFECIAENIDYLITRDERLVRKATQNLKYRKPLVLKPIEANDIFKQRLERYVEDFDYLSSSLRKAH